MSKVSQTAIPVERLPVKSERRDDWVIERPFFHGGETRVQNVFQRVAEMQDAEVQAVLDQVGAKFAHRHQNLARLLEERYDMAAQLIEARGSIGSSRRQLLGSYFTTEYSVASAALFNPSIVAHPDQDGVPAGGLRFIMSLRATGEGHVSSIVFRTGMIRPDHSIHFDPPGALPRRARLSPDQYYVKDLFRRKLREMAIDQQAVESVVGCLQDRFTLDELEHSISESLQTGPDIMQHEETIEGIRWLARENYQLQLPEDADISEMVIFPQSDNERRGIEDLRMVRFEDDDESVTYYGTYSAYDGYRALPQLMETSDLHRIRVHTLNGKCAQNKGMALFPRRIGATT